MKSIPNQSLAHTSVKQSPLIDNLEIATHELISWATRKRQRLNLALLFARVLASESNDPHCLKT